MLTLSRTHPSFKLSKREQTRARAFGIKTGGAAGEFQPLHVCVFCAKFHPDAATFHGFVTCDSSVCLDRPNFQKSKKRC